MKALNFLILFAGVSSVLPQNVIDGFLVKFRHTYVIYKTEALQDLDTSFFRAYSELKSALRKVIDPILKIDSSLTKACASFPSWKLQNSTSARLNNTCRILGNLFDQTSQTLQNGLIAFYPGLLGMPTSSEKKGEEIFYAVEENLNLLASLYSADPKCVTLQLKDHPKCYKPSINSALAASKRTVDNSATLFHEARHATNRAEEYFTSFIAELKGCGQMMNSTSCVKKLVIVFRKLKKLC